VIEPLSEQVINITIKTASLKYDEASVRDEDGSEPVQQMRMILFLRVVAVILGPHSPTLLAPQRSKQFSKICL
jgi:hypothetical protein